MSDAVKDNLSRQIKGNFMRNVKLYTHWKCMICRSAWKMNRALFTHIPKALQVQDIKFRF